MSKEFFDLFQKGFVINLPERTDRRDEIEAELEGVGSRLDGAYLTLFPASRPDDAGQFPSIGARGCFLSHLRVLRSAREADLDTVLILEDDAHFGGAFASGWREVAETLAGETWDIFYAGYESTEAFPVKGPITVVDPISSLRTTHSMALSRKAVETAIPFLESMLERPAGAPDGGPMHVDGAYSWLRRSHPELKTLVATPQIVTQRASRSDIAMQSAWKALPGIALLRRIKNWSR